MLVVVPAAVVYYEGVNYFGSILQVMLSLCDNMVAKYALLYEIVHGYRLIL